MPELKRIVVIGGSAGSLPPLSELVRRLPCPLNAAVFIVLHIPAHSPSQLHGILQRLTRLQVTPGRDGEAIEAGRIYVAVADRHLLLDTGRIRLTRGPHECRARPAIDALFRSAAAAFGPRVIGVLLSGALDDGTAGLWAIKDRGGIALVQDPDTAEHPSMPKSAARHVELDGSLPASRLAAEIERLSEALPGPAPTASGVPDAMAIENLIALEGQGLQSGVMKLGKMSQYTCPDCHGVLVQIDEGSIVRFRCHTGHAFSAQTLLAEVNGAIDLGLWSTLRAVEERILLLRQMGDMAAATGDGAATAHCRAQAAEAESRLGPLRELVMNPALFDHLPTQE